MKLLLIFAAILAFSLAEEKKKVEVVNDSEAEASATIELMKEGVDLNTAASSYNSYVPPSQRPPHWNVKPIQPVQTSVPANVQNDYYQWSTPVYHPPTTTTPVSVIKNEQYYGENGHYKYEYQIADGTHVGEEGYFTDPKQTEESLVKKGWYSYVGADGKKYTVTYWADHTGFHAYGDHLPTPPPPYKPVVENKPLYDYPTQTQAPAVFYPTQPAPVPVKPIYVPPQPTLPPVQQPTYAPQPSYPPQNYIPPQQTYYPPQQTYYPPQQNYYPQQNHV